MTLQSGVESEILAEQEEALKDENAMVKILRALESTDGEKGGWWTIFPRSGMDSTGRPCKKNDYVV